MNRHKLANAVGDIQLWIDATIAKHQANARSIASLQFPRLSHYFDESLLASTNAIVVPHVPVVPLTALGLPELADFESMKADGITYLNSFFVRSAFERDESLYFHELVHVLQWQMLGPERFLMSYAIAHLHYGYRDNPFETMAYDLQAAFDRQGPAFGVETRVRSTIEGIASSLLSISE